MVERLELDLDDLMADRWESFLVAETVLSAAEV